MKSSNQSPNKARSAKIKDPVAYFAGWYFVIEPHNYWTLGVELKTFFENKVPYQSWAYMNPPNYNFCQGYIFYSQFDQNIFLQVGAEQGLFEIEVFEGRRSEIDSDVSGWLVTLDGLAQWLRTGCKPITSKKIDFALSKSGLMAWQLINKKPDDGMCTP